MLISAFHWKILIWYRVLPDATGIHHLRLLRPFNSYHGALPPETIQAWYRAGKWYNNASWEYAPMMRDLTEGIEMCYKMHE